MVGGVPVQCNTEGNESRMKPESDTATKQGASIPVHNADKFYFVERGAYNVQAPRSDLKGVSAIPIF
jgi:hypothetical protein